MFVKANWLLRAFAVCGLAVILSGCATGARTGAMTVPVGGDLIVPDNSPLHNAFRVGTVDGGSDTNPLWKSNVSDENFRQALEQSLSLQAMIAPERGRYTVNAKLIELDQPIIGFDMTVTAKVRYTVMMGDAPGAKFDETIETPYTANFSDAFLGVERLRLANEGAIQANIKAFIEKLVAASQPGQALSA